MVFNGLVDRLVVGFGGVQPVFRMAKQRKVLGPFPSAPGTLRA
jgi:hypothetical protein